MKASELAACVGGTLHGEDRVVVGVAPLSSAGADEAAYCEDRLPDECAAGVLLIREPIPGRSCVVTADPKRAFITLLHHLFPEVHEPGVHPGATVHPTAVLAAGVVVYPGAWVGPGVTIGADTVVFPNAVLLEGTEVGARCRIGPGCVLGSAGFSYHPGPAGPEPVPQVGGVRIEDDVVLGANTCVDRAFMGKTVVGQGSGLDNLVHVGHNVRLGRGVLAAAQVGLSGSVVVEDGVVLGGQVGVGEHRRIGARSALGGQSGVTTDVPADSQWMGTPAMPAARMRRIYGVWRRLPEMWRELYGIGRKVSRVEPPPETDP